MSRAAFMAARWRNNGKLFKKLANVQKRHGPGTFSQSSLYVCFQ